MIDVTSRRDGMQSEYDAMHALKLPTLVTVLLAAALTLAACGGNEAFGTFDGEPTETNRL
ncbi:MAG: hypothetical protein AAFO77_05885 [Pseudomonadota bacterium]